MGNPSALMSSIGCRRRCNATCTPAPPKRSNRTRKARRARRHCSWRSERRLLHPCGRASLSTFFARRAAAPSSASSDDSHGPMLVLALPNSRGWSADRAASVAAHRISLNAASRRAGSRVAAVCRRAIGESRTSPPEHGAEWTPLRETRKSLHSRRRSPASPHDEA